MLPSACRTDLPVDRASLFRGFPTAMAGSDRDRMAVPFVRARHRLAILRPSGVSFPQAEARARGVENAGNFAAAAAGCVPRENELPERLRRAHLTFFRSASFAFARRAASLAWNFAMRSISVAGTGSVSGKRSVPLLALYGVSAPLNAATSASLAG
jgi:hypothetical protein